MREDKCEKRRAGRSFFSFVGGSGRVWPWVKNKKNGCKVIIASKKCNYYEFLINKCEYFHKNDNNYCPIWFNNSEGINVFCVTRMKKEQLAEK